MEYLRSHPSLSQELHRTQQNDLEHGLCYLDAVRFLKEAMKRPMSMEAGLIM
jgi:hypothetical protein